MASFADFFNQYQQILIAICSGLIFFAFVRGMIELIEGSRDYIKRSGIITLKRRDIWGRKNF